MKANLYSNYGSQRIFILFTIFFLIHLYSCKKDTPDPDPPDRTLKVWLHHVDDTVKAKHFQNSYSGYELDVHFDTDVHTFIVKHDFNDTVTLTLSAWLDAITNPERLGYWLDFKNLAPWNEAEALTELLRIRQLHGLIHNLIIVESTTPNSLPRFDTLNFRPSYYIPTFNPSGITPEEEEQFYDFIEGSITSYGLSTISGYSFQESFMQKWFPDINKLLWFLDSVDPEVKDSIIEQTQKNPTVEVLLVAEDFPSSLLVRIPGNRMVYQH